MKKNCAVLILALIGTLACRTTQSPEGQVEDVHITTEIKAKLASDIRASTLTNVAVNSTNGIVTLAGQVRSQEERRAVEEAARSVKGVARVNSNLQLVSP